VEALERAARPLRIEGSRGDLASGEIVKNRARYGRLADPTLVRANQNDDGLSHLVLPQTTQLRYATTENVNTNTLLTWRTKSWQKESKVMEFVLCAFGQ
jgi:hypothetical protein